jgi:hypothetical protein
MQLCTERGQSGDLGVDLVGLDVEVDTGRGTNSLHHELHPRDRVPKVGVVGIACVRRGILNTYRAPERDALVVDVRRHVDHAAHRLLRRIDSLHRWLDAREIGKTGGGIHACLTYRDLERRWSSSARRSGWTSWMSATA